MTLGQLAYEAYATHTGWKSLVTNQAIPPWSQLKPEIQQAWEAVGYALEEKIIGRRITGGYPCGLGGQ